MGSFDSLLARFVFESCLHSLLALMIVEAALRLWELRSPLIRFRFRILPLVLPVVMFPVFQWISSDRGSFYFVQDLALFSIWNWLRVPLFGNWTLTTPVVSILALTCVVTLLQEILPSLKFILARRQAPDPPLSMAPPGLQKVVEEISGSLGVRVPAVGVIPDSQPIVLVRGTRNPELLISEGVLTRLSSRQVRAALTHELAHILRQSTSTTLLVFLVRAVTFYNPISLLLFRRLVQDDEQICDDLTVELTGSADALAETLALFRNFRGDEGARSVSQASQRILLEERIERLNSGEVPVSQEMPWVVFAAVTATILGLSYGVV